MEGFSDWTIALIIAIGVLWVWTNGKFKMHERVIDKLEDELDRVRRHVDLDSREMEREKEIHRKTIIEIEREKREWLKEHEGTLAFIEKERKFLEEDGPTNSSYASLEELEEDLKLFLEESEDRKPPHMD